MKENRFYENIKKHIDLSESEFAKLSSFYHVEEIQKNQMLLSEGEICDFEGYILEGCFKIFYKEDNVKDHILYFAIEDWWVLDIGSFVSGNPSKLNIQALEDSKIITITKEQKEKLYAEIPKTERLFRLMNQKALESIQLCMISMLNKTADKRYLEFKAKYPTLEQRIPQHQIAAYLGISHEFLSKIRRKLL
ncbi:Crp/Fnr family transcriptional regulator [Flavobacterium branchiicola]|uniref:Crp/Fnr family transcriptional regulator n=1 Tax=Flavobacterium branchiicola TaxID=1114875 RepID=A0ABV9PG31_9FLAO|nr:Crp/Fnr family transcriptional regulator [Flavobacterium branchiicola]MBS7255720.1 Crp/Fnr family transcriptional regulator [Flavobacterium branchiicola]